MVEKNEREREKKVKSKTNIYCISSITNNVLTYFLQKIIRVIRKCQSGTYHAVYIP